MHHHRPSVALARRSARLGAALAIVVLVAAGCSSGDSSGSDGSGGSSTSTAKAAVVKDANAVCKAGKARTLKIVPGTLVVPNPKTAKEKAATKKWADATADAIDQTADELEAIDSSGDPAAQLALVVTAYRDAADTLRTDGGAVLGQQNFLSDQALFDYGFTVCVAPVKDDATTTTTKP